MKNKHAILRVGSAKVLWGVVPLLLFTATCALALTIGAGQTVTISSLVQDFVTVQNGGTLNMDPGAQVWGITVQAGGVANFYGGEVLYNGVTGVQDTAAVTIYGTELIAIPDTPNTTLTTVTGYYENTDPIYLIFSVAAGGTLTLEDLAATGPQEITIDIKPDSEDNVVNLGSNGVIPVAILSTDTFDATEIDPNTVTLAGAGVAVRGKGNKFLSSTKDVNGDGLLDLEVKVETENLDPGNFQDGMAILQVKDGETVTHEGADSITIVPPA